MNSYESLIDLLIRDGYLKTPEIISAFKKIDRINFVSPEMVNQAYGNHPLPIGLGQTISQPATVAFMLELLQAKKGDKVLDVGSGSGWQTALLAEIVGSHGQVIGLEIKDDLLKLAKSNLARYNLKNIELIQGNGWQGLPSQAPFAKIIVAAASDKIPKALKEQLAVGGKLVIPIGSGIQDIISLDKINKDEFKETHYPGFVFVPLVNNQ